MLDICKKRVIWQDTLIGKGFYVLLTNTDYGWQETWGEDTYEVNQLEI